MFYSDAVKTIYNKNMALRFVIGCMDSVSFALSLWINKEKYDPYNELLYNVGTL